MSPMNQNPILSRTAQLNTNEHEGVAPAFPLIPFKVVTIRGYIELRRQSPRVCTQ